MSEHTNADPEVLTDHTDMICSTSIERIVTGRNAALEQIRTVTERIGRNIGADQKHRR
ncbi:restriction methylase [Salmonella enterica subsp. enterica]|uniref:Restriction methylase n=1 Tax=Salmonella enterica I TaxID=59201 RepID=A0A379V1X3_SALET|nr:restriction methylase [Salmonella enterica subsp. enterica]